MRTPRRSPRFPPQKNSPEKAKIQVPKSRKNRVCHSPISSGEKTHSDSSLSSIENASLKRTLRRSPRFLPQKNSPEKVKIQIPKSRKNRVCHSPISSAEKTHSDSPLSSIENASQKTRNHEGCPEKIKKKSTGSSGVSKISAESLNGSGKAMRSMDGVEIFPCLRRSTRFCSPESAFENVDYKAGDNNAKPLMSQNLTDFSDIELSLEVTKKGNLGKNQAMSGFTKVVEKTEECINSSSEFAKDREGKRRSNSSVASPAMTPKGGGEKRSRDMDRWKEEIGVNRKRKQCEEGFDIHGWTKDQEAALQKAFFAAKPSPHFWKKVSKLVPGKSAQECFDKVHSDLITPPQPQPRSRANRTNSSPLGHFSLSASKLLEPIELTVKRPRAGKQKSHLAQRTVRHLLQKHYLVDQGFEVDLFSDPENGMNSSTRTLLQTNILSTPKCIAKKPGSLQKCHEKSSSAHKKSSSRMGSSHETVLVSPPVLKQVKNMVLHEKYIDQLHSRDARRAAASACATKCTTSEKNGKENHIQKTDVVRAARNALVSDARDVINQFQHLQANGLSNYDNFDDDYDSEDKGDDGPG